MAQRHEKSKGSLVRALSRGALVMGRKMQPLAWSQCREAAGSVINMVTSTSFASIPHILTECKQNLCILELRCYNLWNSTSLRHRRRIVENNWRISSKKTC
jgi:hypothetical protein